MQNKKIGRPLQGRTGLFSRGNKYEKEEEEEEEEEEVEEERSFTFYLCGSLFFVLPLLRGTLFIYTIVFSSSSSSSLLHSLARRVVRLGGGRHRQPVDGTHNVSRFFVSLSLSLYLDFSFSFFFSPSFPFCRPYFFSPFYFVPSPRYFIPAASLRFGYQY